MSNETMPAQGPVDVNVGGWTSVSAALPTDGQRVLCWENCTRIGKQWQGAEVFYYRDGIGFVNLPDDDDAYGCITHWIPLPDHPDLVGGIVWADCELRWINERITLAILAEREACAKIADAKDDMMEYGAGEEIRMRSNVEVTGLAPAQENGK